jgi:hypothetical protein
VNDEWRLQVNFGSEEDALAVMDRMRAGQLEHDLSLEFHDKVIVSRDADRLFVYAGSRGQIDEATSAIEADAQKHGWKVTCELRRWHPVAEEWEDPGKQLPASEAARHDERGALMARERAATVSKGYPEFEVRVDLPSHRDVIALSSRLDDEGLPAVHRWRYLLVGATDEDEAKELADRIENEAPLGAQVKVEGSWAAVNHERRNPFAVISSA